MTDKPVTTNDAPEFIIIEGKRWQKVKPIEGATTGEHFQVIVNGWGYRKVVSYV